MLALACTGGTRILSFDDGQPGGRSTVKNALVGTWQATLVVTLATDIQRWTTTWSFAEAGGCHFHQVVVSVLAGGSDTKDRSCTWTTANGSARIRFTDTGAVVEVPYSFVGGATDRLLFEGIEYHRVPPGTIHAS